MTTPVGRHHTAGTHGKRPGQQRWRRPPLCLCASDFRIFAFGLSGAGASAHAPARATVRMATANLTVAPRTTKLPFCLGSQAA